MYMYLRERFKHAVRFRHKRGFGVHSPFMFNFILNVIRDRRHRFVYPAEAERQKDIRYRDRKFYRLLHRLCVYQSPCQVLCIGDKNERLRQYLQRPGEKGNMMEDRPEAWTEADMVYVGPESAAVLSGMEILLAETMGKKKQCVVISDIHKKGFNASFWQLLAVRSTVRVDMMWYGILLFDEKLQKGSYNLMI